MFKHHLLLCASAFCLTLATPPAQAAETRIHAFNLLCDGTTRNVVYNVTGLGTSVNRFIQGASFAVSDPRGGVKFLRLQRAGDPTKMVIDMGSGQTGARVDMTGSLIQMTTDASGAVPMNIIGACEGGGILRGFATIVFFS